MHHIEQVRNFSEEDVFHMPEIKDSDVLNAYKGLKASDWEALLLLLFTTPATQSRKTQRTRQGKRLGIDWLEKVREISSTGCYFLFGIIFLAAIDSSKFVWILRDARSYYGAWIQAQYLEHQNLSLLFAFKFVI
ncbi:hypothetical protein Bca52824_026459 [Brassica carinata]|uniref:Uncharacterized protein n=1 Tax=Brassica carinata TaxID=52824 RepID=A0A8X7VAA6_BRACI|nr:hypothetical protein Bca52824_026459 [Brassica carinata]